MLKTNIFNSNMFDRNICQNWEQYIMLIIKIINVYCCLTPEVMELNVMFLWAYLVPFKIMSNRSDGIECDVFVGLSCSI